MFTCRFQILLVLGEPSFAQFPIYNRQGSCLHAQPDDMELPGRRGSSHKLEPLHAWRSAGQSHGLLRCKTECFHMVFHVISPTPSIEMQWPAHPAVNQDAVVCP